MSQSKRASWLEALANTLIGYFISVGVQALIFPLWGIRVSIWDNLEIGLVFLVVSILRGYMIRRWFNAMMVRAIESLDRRLG